MSLPMAWPRMAGWYFPACCCLPSALFTACVVGSYAAACIMLRVCCVMFSIVSIVLRVVLNYLHACSMVRVLCICTLRYQLWIDGIMMGCAAVVVLCYAVFSSSPHSPLLSSSSPLLFLCCTCDGPVWWCGVVSYLCSTMLWWDIFSVLNSAHYKVDLKYGEQASCCNAQPTTPVTVFLLTALLKSLLTYCGLPGQLRDCRAGNSGVGVPVQAPAPAAGCGRCGEACRKLSHAPDFWPTDPPPSCVSGICVKRKPPYSWYYALATRISLACRSATTLSRTGARPLKSEALMPYMCPRTTARQPVLAPLLMVLPCAC